MSEKDPAALRGPVTFAVMLATLMISLDATIVNVALPNMQGALSASPEQITWVVTSYFVTSAVMTPIAGWLAGRFGLKASLIAVVAGFTGASLLCALATTLPEIVMFRIFQGVFGAAMMPFGQAVLLNINPPERHAQAMAAWSIATFLGPLAGPALGGWLTDELSWRWCFYINLPVGAVAILLLLLFMPRARSARRPLDVLGFVALALAVGAFQLLLDRGPGQDWFASREIWAELVVAIIGFWVFVTHTLTGRKPLFHPTLATDRNLIGATAVGFFMSVLMFSSLTLLPLMMQGVLGYPAFLTGMVNVPRGVALLITTLLAGRLAGHVDLRLMIAIGVTICAAAFVQMSRFDLAMGYGPIVLAGVVQGLGQGLIFAPLATLAFATVDPGLRAEASAMHGLVRMLGGSVGIAAMQAMAYANGQTMHASLAGRIVASDPLVAELPRDFAPDALGGLLALDAEIGRQASMVAFLNDFRVMVAVAILSLPLLLLLRPLRPAPPRPGRG